MTKVFPLEIKDFYSLKELNSFIDKEISWYEFVLKEYNQHLGSLLREQGEGQNEEELLKKLREKGFTSQEKKRKKKGKGKKTEEAESRNWFTFRSIMFSASKESRAEIYFEAVEKIKSNLERLKEVKALIEELMKAGLGSDLIYSSYLVDGIPQKIVIQQRRDGESEGIKYRFEIDLSTSVDATRPSAESPEETALSEEAIATS